MARAIATVAAVAVLVRLSWWQWSRARAHGSLQSYTYAVEWLLLAIVLVVAGLVLRRRPHRPPGDDGAARDVEGRLIGPPLPPGQELGEPAGARLRRRFSRRA